MAVERVQPSDLDLAQQRLAGLEAQLCATLEDTLMLTDAGEFDAAVLRLEQQSDALDGVMEALARDMTGLRVLPDAPKRTFARRPVRWIAAAAITMLTLAGGASLLRSDPLADLATKIAVAEDTEDPRARLRLIEDAYASLRTTPEASLASSTMSYDLAKTALRTRQDLADTNAPRAEQQRAAVIARALDPRAPLPPRSDAGSPTDPIVNTIPRR